MVPIPPVIQWWTINPDASVDEVLSHIKQQGELPVFSGRAESDIIQDNVDLDVLVNELVSISGSDTVHNAPGEDYREKLSVLCRTYEESCGVVVLDGSYTPKQQYSYQLMVAFMVTKLASFGYDPLTSLRTLTINNYTKNKRWYANAKLMVLNTYQMLSNKEFLQVLAHEMWHVIDLWVVVGTSRQINPDYTEFGKAKFSVDDQSLVYYAISWLNEDTMRQRMTDTDFCSGYGASNPFEDFAECGQLYLYHRDVFSYLADSSPVLQRKFDYFDKLYQSQYLSANFNDTDLTELDVRVRPWDTTRM
jgi:hypothetical protein